MHLAIAGKVVFRHEEKYLDALRAAVMVSGIKNRVHFVDELRDVSPLLQAADLLVLNSLDEPFGLVLIEAMSSGTPVLATRVGGIPEIVSDSENGWLVEKGDTPALAAKLLELSHNRIALLQVAQHALRTTCPLFSLNRFHNELANLYAELCPKLDPIWNLRDPRALARSGNN
jgi:glycosyltransferase involved in cell wall biosynthesis